MNDGVNAPAAAEGTPWFRQAAFYLSLCSLLVSALAVLLSTRHTAQEDLSKRRAELTGYIQRIATLNSETEGAVSSEQAALVKVAADLALETPEIPAIFYRQIAEGFRQVYAEDNASQFSELALTRARLTNDLIEEVEIHRLTKASIALDNGDVAGMREAYEAALDVTKQYKGNKVTLLYDVPGFTEVLWGTDEANLGNCAEAERHLREVERYVESRPLRSGTLDENLVDLEKAVSACGAEA